MRRLVLLLGLFLIALPAGVAHAESFPVTTTDDDGAGSLRAAIEAANGFDAGEVDKIPIQVSGVIALETALPPIVESVHISGPGPASLKITRSPSAGDFRIFETVPLTNVAFIGLTVTDGVAQLGGGIYGGGEIVLDHVVIVGNEATDSGGEDAIARGGGVFVEDWLVIRDSLIRGNRAIAREGSKETRATGGGITSIQELTMERSTIADNDAEAHAEGGAEAVAFGGGAQIVNHATIYTSTFSGNAVFAEEGTALNNGSGGGIQGAEAQLLGLTISGNSASVSGSNLDLNLDSSVRDTIVAEPRGVAESCSSRLPSGGFNIDEDSSCEFDEGTDLEAVVPALAPLADNGGPTPTHALQPGSAAIDRGFSFGTTTDQRKLPRRSDFVTVSNSEGGDGSDIGAFELQAPPQLAAPAGMRVDVVSGDRTAPNTRIVSGPPRVTFKRLAKFRFASTEAQSRFQCKVDKSRWRGCRNPFKRKVVAGKDRGRKHLFKVRAIDRFGNVDKSPARFSWRVKKVGG